MERRSKMSAWNRHQTPSFKPANTAPYHGGNGGGSSGPQASVPDVSIRNHKRWKTVFERAIAEYVHRGHPGADELTALVRRAINRLLDKEPGAQTFKSFQVISDIIDALGTGSYSL